MLEILEDELVSAMGLTGLTSIDQITPEVHLPGRAGHRRARDEQLGQHARRAHHLIC